MIKGGFQILIVNSKGTIVKEIEQKDNQFRYELDVSQLAEGFYFVKVLMNGLQEFGAKSLMIIR